MMKKQILFLLASIPILAVAQHPDTIPFTLSEFNNILVDVVLNQKDSLTLKFDSGTTGLLLTHEAIAEKTRLMDEEDGETTYDYRPLISTSRLDIDSWHWDSLEVFPVSLSGQGTDGRFGWDLFHDCILEIDYDASVLVIHETLPTKSEAYSKMDLHRVSSLFSIEADIELSGQRYRSKFLFDTGYQKALLLDSTLLAKQGFPASINVLKSSVLRNGAGERFVTKVIECEHFLVNDSNLILDSIPAQLLTTRNPAGFEIHILGNELLCRMNVIFDFPAQHIYLQKSGYFNRPYIY